MAEQAMLQASGHGAGTRYGAGRRINLRSAVLTAAVHAAALPLALGLSHERDARRHERLVMVDLTSPTAAAPPPQSVAAPAPAPAVVVPPARLAVPETPPVVAVVAPLPLTPSAPAIPVPVVAAEAPAQSSGARTAPAPPATPGIISADRLDTSLIAGAPPRYPHESRRKREQGTVRLLLLVGTDGAVETISIAQSSGSPRLDQAALKAVRQWRWQPARRDGQPVRVRGIIEIPFVLTSARKSSPHADCDTANSRCDRGDSAARDHRRGRMDRRDSDLRGPGPDGEEQPPAARE